MTITGNTARLWVWMAALALVGGVLGVPGLAYGQAGGGKASTSERELVVVASIPPVLGIVKPLLEEAGVAHKVESLIPPGVSEHGYEIPPGKLSQLRRADVVVLVGLGLEPQVEKFLKQNASSSRRVVVLADAVGINLDHDAKDHANHAHGPDGECLHIVDPHIWLDPVLVEKMVSAVAQSLRDAAAARGVGVVASEASKGADVGTRLWMAEEAMLKRVRGVHEAYEQGLKPARVRTIVVGHDAWGYLARRYGLETVAIKGLLATEPTPKSLSEATRTVKDKGLSTVFVEPQLSQKAGQSIASATGARVRMLDPLGRGDWFAMMEANLTELKNALGVGGGGPEAVGGSRNTGDSSASK